jgi:hypothetical protein
MLFKIHPCFLGEVQIHALVFDLYVFPSCTSFSSFILQQTYPPFIRRKLVDFAFVFGREINDIDP